MKLNKKQKRTATIASMAALLAVVLGMGGQTFAKYITTNTIESDTATVAKFGLNVQTRVVSGVKETAFKSSYNGGAIKAAAPVVAPGASGSITFVVNGSAEVNASISLDISDYTGVRLSYDSKNYYPIQWATSVDGSGKLVGATTDPTTLSYADLTYEVGDTVSDITFTVYWAWPMDGVASSGVNGLTGDEADTILGKIAYDASNATVDGVTYGYNLGVEFTAKATITQTA